MLSLNPLLSPRWKPGGIPISEQYLTSNKHGLFAFWEKEALWPLNSYSGKDALLEGGEVLGAIGVHT